MEEFKLERYFSEYEFDSQHLLCSSDCEPFIVSELFDLCKTSPLALMDLSMGYTTSKGSPELREEIAKLHVNIESDDVLTFAGAQEAIYVFSRSVLKKGDEVIVQFPTYQSLYQVPLEIGCEVKYWNMNPEKNWSLDIEELRNLITPKTKCIILNLPGNPTGLMLDKEDLLEVVLLARQYGIYILCDEVYRFLEYKAADRVPSICELYELGVSINVMSKSFGLPGLRIGWAASRSQFVIEAMNTYKDYTSLCNNVFGEFISTLALKNSQLIHDRNLDITRGNLSYFDQFLNKHSTILSSVIPKAGSVLLMKIKSKMSTLELCRDIHVQKSLFLLPSETFNYGSGYIRVGIGRRSFSTALDAFDEYLEDNPGI